jgi:hypothetical protein
MIAAIASVALATNPAVYGYDVVEYFSLDAASAGVMGSPDHTASMVSMDNSSYAEHLRPTSYTFQFKNEANRALFVANPTKYAPKYGGF